MKVRFGFSAPGHSEMDLEGFPRLVQDLERFGFDSVWLPEIMLGGLFDPIVTLSHAAALTKRLKLGAYLIVPGRNPVRLARELANLDRLSGGRLLLMMVMGVPTPAELFAQDVEKSERAALFDEVVPLLRRLWSGEEVDHEGPRYSLKGARLLPTPLQAPLEMWFGGQLPGALRRAGRLSDGWMPGLFATPKESGEMRIAIERAAEEAGRSIDPEHFGAGLSYRRGPLSDATLAQLRRGRPDFDPETMIPEVGPALEQRVDEWLEAGFSKFLLRPATPVGARKAGGAADMDLWTEELERLAADILHRQT